MSDKENMLKVCPEEHLCILWSEALEDHLRYKKRFQMIDAELAKRKRDCDKTAEEPDELTIESNTLLCVANDEEKPYGVEDDCSLCEFCITAVDAGAIGAMIGSRGTYRYCEKGYWKEDT